MKVNELRKGNLLYYHSTNLVGTVSLISEFVFDCRNEIGSFTPNCKYDPIPLTEEILSKCGFDFSAFKKPMQTCGVDLFYGHDYYFKRIGYKTDLILRSLNGVFRIECFYSTRIQYLHQLQNLYFALTGEELEVKL